MQKAHTFTACLFALCLTGALVAGYGYKSSCGPRRRQQWLKKATKRAARLCR